MKKRLLSGLLTVMLLFSAAFAADGDAAPQEGTGETVFSLEAVLSGGYDTAQLDRDLETVQSVLTARLTFLGYGDTAVSRRGELGFEVTLSGTADADTLADTLTAPARLSFQDADGAEWLTGADIRTGESAYGRTGDEPVDIYYIEIEFTEDGAKKFSEATNAIAARADGVHTLSVLLDGKTFATVSIDKASEATGCYLVGEFTEADAARYANLISSGALPLSLRRTDASATTPAEPEPPAPLFPDLSGHWAETAMTKGAELGLIQGVGGKALPDSPVKYDEALILLNRALGAEGQADISSMPNVPANAWYAADVAKAVYLGLADAANGRNFDTPATRAEAFVLLARAFVYSGAGHDDAVLARFTDTDAMTAAERDAAKALIAAGIVEGNASGTLDPAGRLTRAQFITMLLRIVPNFPGEEDDLTMLSGGALLKTPDLDFTSVDPDGDRIFAPAVEKVTFSGVNANYRLVFKGAETLSVETRNKSALAELALDAKGDAKAALSDGCTLGTLLLAGAGGEVSYQGAADRIEITATGRAIDLSGMEAERLTITGADNTVTLGGSVDEVVLAPSARNTTLTVDGEAGAVTVSAIGCTVDGAGKAESIDVRTVGCTVTLAADSSIETIDPGLSGVTINMGVPAAVAPGGSLLAVARFEGVSESKRCTAQWYRDGKPLGQYRNDAFLLTADVTSRHTAEFTFVKGMAKSVTIGFELLYDNPSTGKTERVYHEETVPIRNYSDEWYYQRDVNRVLNLVSSTYNGNWTQSYAINNDYESYEKEVFVNAKGYSSNSKYLLWVNRAYQHVNVFTGSAGSWKLDRSFLVGTGALSSPTPTGVTTITYKSAGGWTTANYTVRPVVGFYPGSGYAFHSRLCYPGTDTEYDFSGGYPISHGCVRMYKADVRWIYDTVPIGTTVVIF